MAAIIPEPNWGDPAGDPPSTIPGPSNPWAMCTDTGGDGMVPGSSDGDGLPIFNQPAWPQQPCDGFLFGLGVGLLVIGGLSFGASALAIAAWGAEIAGSGVLMAMLLGLTATGTTSILGGLGFMTAAFDPPVLDHTVSVPVPARRAIALPKGAPPPLMALVDALIEIEVLTNGSVDVLDAARAAAAAGDAAAYDMHLRNLWAIQDCLNQQKSALADVLDALADHPKADLQAMTFDPATPLQDLANPIAALRPQFVAAGGTNAELTAALGALRWDAYDAWAGPSVNALITKHGATAAGLLHGAADMLRQLDFVTWDAFGGKPA